MAARSFGTSAKGRRRYRQRQTLSPTGLSTGRLCADGLTGSEGFAVWRFAVGQSWAAPFNACVYARMVWRGARDSRSGGLRLVRVGQRHSMHAFERGWFGGGRGNALPPMHARTGAGRIGIMEADACAATARMNRLETAARSGGLARNGDRCEHGGERAAGTKSSGGKSRTENSARRMGRSWRTPFTAGEGQSLRARHAPKVAAIMVHGRGAGKRAVDDGHGVAL